MILYTGTYTSSKKMALGMTIPVTLPLTITFHPAVIEGDLAYVDMVCVKAEGVAYDIIYSGTPGNRQVLYKKSLGALLFAYGSPVQNVYVMYQK